MLKNPFQITETLKVLPLTEYLRGAALFFHLHISIFSLIKIKPAPCYINNCLQFAGSQSPPPGEDLGGASTAPIYP